MHKSLDQSAENDSGFIAESVIKMSEYIISDRSVTQLQTLGEKFREYEFGGIKEIEGESTTGGGFVEFHANEDSITKLIIELFYTPAE